MNRRGFLGGLLSAPAIIRPGLLMRVKPRESYLTRLVRDHVEVTVGPLTVVDASWLASEQQSRFTIICEVFSQASGIPMRLLQPAPAEFYEFETPGFGQP